MSYAPAILSAKNRQLFSLGEYTALLLADIESAGSIEYLYILAVYDGDAKNPSYFVTSEVNAMAKLLGGGSHFLGVFNEGVHANYGSSDDWADEAKFVAEALHLTRKKFGIQE